MKSLKHLWLIFFALIALFLGSFSAILFVDRVSSVSAASNVPLAKPVTIISRTLTISAGYFCSNPTEYGTSNSVFVDSDPEFCVADSIPLTNPPISMACVWNQPTFDTGWRNCYEIQLPYGYVGIGLLVDVVWNHQQLELLLLTTNNSPTNAIFTVMYSAFI